MPWNDITTHHLEQLKARNVRESDTLEFKEEFSLTDSGRIDFLQDVTAMANAAGGTIVYGAVEGEDDEKGILVNLRPIEGGAHDRQEAVTNILRDGVQEQIPGILHRALEYGSGYLYVVRVPQSPLAPHMITLKGARWRFYLRTNTSNNPMSVQQIKEVVMRSEGAIERAKALVDTRTEQWKRITGYADPDRPHVIRGAAQALLHLIPLYPRLGISNLADPSLVRRFRQVPAFFEGQPAASQRISLLGLTNESWLPRQKSVTLLRQGGLEFYASGLASQDHSGDIVDGFDLEQAIIDAFNQAKDLADAGIVLPPLLISLRLFHMGAARLMAPTTRARTALPLPDEEAYIEPFLLNDWAGRSAIERPLFDVIWQAWGDVRSPHYSENGVRLLPPQR